VLIDHLLGMTSRSVHSVTFLAAVVNSWMEPVKTSISQEFLFSHCLTFSVSSETPRISLTLVYLVLPGK
jgi:hypothetical protein